MPKLLQPNEKKRTRCFRLSDDVHEKLQKLAKKQGISVGRYITALISDKYHEQARSN